MTRRIAAIVTAAALVATASAAQTVPDTTIEVDRQALEEAVELRSQRLERLVASADSTEGEEYLVLIDQIGRLELELLDLFDEMVDLNDEAGAAGEDTSEFDAFFQREFVSATPYIIDLIEQTESTAISVKRWI